MAKRRIIGYCAKNLKALRPSILGWCRRCRELLKLAFILLPWPTGSFSQWVFDTPGCTLLLLPLLLNFYFIIPISNFCGQGRV
jgi:hypothetical protein